MAKEEPPTQTPPPPYPGYPVPLVVYPPEQPINWSEYWRVIVKNRKLIGIITAASTLIALLIAFLLPPVYRAEVLLAPVSEDKSEGLSAIANQYGDLAALAGINLASSKDKTAEYIATLKSRALSVAFIKEENLMPILFARKWDAAKKQWRSGDAAPTAWEAYKLWDDDIRSVNVDRKSGLVTLAIEWKDPALAASWANDLVKKANNKLRTEAVEDAEKSVAYLKRQLDHTSSVEIQQAIYRLIETQTKKKMIANTKEEYAFTIIDPAVRAEKPRSPKKLTMTLVGALLGLSGVVAYVLMRNTKRSSS